MPVGYQPAGGSGGGGTVSAASFKWAHLKMSAGVSGLDDAALLTNMDTIVAGSTNHGITVSSGVITLPANTTGYKWRLQASLAGTMSATSDAQTIVSWCTAPTGAKTEVGQVGSILSYTYSATKTGVAGLAQDALHHIAAASPVTVGVKIVSITSTDTVTIDNTLSKVLIEEVPE